MPTQAYPPDLYYEVMDGGDVLLYPNQPRQRRRA